MSNLILLQKLLFLHHLATLPETSLAREVYDLQNQLNLPGLVSECQEFLRDHEFVAIYKYSKFQWKRTIKKIILEKNKDDLIKMSQKYKKIDFYSETDLTTRHHFLNFLNEPACFIKFGQKWFHYPDDFPNDKNFTSNLWLCVGCKVCLDTQTHVTLCKSYEMAWPG